MQDALIGFVLDKSGSMASVADDTLGGFNQFLHDQQEAEGNAWMSLTLFDTTFDVRYVAWGIRDVPDLGGPNSPYYPGGMTALYDAVATTIKGIEQWLSSNQWFTGKIMLAILTDGMENSSMEWTADSLNSLIEEKTEAGWEFLFLGAGPQAWAQSRALTAIPQDRVHAYAGDGESTKVAYASISEASLNTRRSGAEWKIPTGSPTKK